MPSFLQAAEAVLRQVGSALFLLVCLVFLFQVTVELRAIRRLLEKDRKDPGRHDEER